MGGKCHCLQHQSAELCGRWHTGSTGVQGCGSRDTGSKGVQGWASRETYRGTFELLHQLPILLLQLLIQVLNLLLLGLQLLLQLLSTVSPRKSASEGEGFSPGHTHSYVEINKA